MNSTSPQSQKFLGAVLAGLLLLVLAPTLSFGQNAPAAAAPAASAAATPSLPLLPDPLVPGDKVVPLWPAGSPMLGNSSIKGFDQPENVTGRPGRVSAVRNVQNPSIELRPAPADKNTGTAIILASGGANTSENVGPEGTQVATWLNSIGINAVIIRYRLQPYKSTTDARNDSLQSIRVVRANAKEWGIDPNKIGYMGFSAGGEQAARVMIDYDHGDPNSADPIAKVSSRPDFAVLVYAGWANGTMDTSKIPNDVPPAFMTVAADDKFHADQTLDFYEAVYDKIYEVNKNAKFLPELHVYSHGGHANSISPRNGIPFGTWQFRFQEWLADLDKQNAAAAAPAAKAGQ